MARVPVADLLQRQRAAQAARVEKLVERRGRPRRSSPGRVHDAMREMARAADWSKATARHFVALYVWMHATVYGVESELAMAAKASRNALYGAEAAAKRMLEQEFRGNGDAMAGYVRWAWLREKQREARANGEGRERGRIGWQLMFSSRSLLQDYRLSARRAAAG